MYLDYAATTPIDSRVMDYMCDVLKNEYGNPLSKYYSEAVSAKEILDLARVRVCDLINANSKNVIFTSGASESNTMAIRGIMTLPGNTGKHIVTSSIEHKSIMETCRHLEQEGYLVTYVQPNHNGVIELKSVIDAIQDDTVLVSIMWVNNETGVINPINLISKFCKKRNIFFHTDATQAVGKIEIDIIRERVDFMSFTAHKINGPKGVGALYISNDDLGIRHKIKPLIHGGKQEYSLRGGTHSLHNIAGFGLASELSKAEWKEKYLSVEKLSKQFIVELRSRISEVVIVGEKAERVHGILNIALDGFNNDMFTKMYADRLSVSTGSACAFGEPSHVITSINDQYVFKNHLRISFSSESDDLLEVIDYIEEYINIFV